MEVPSTGICLQNFYVFRGGREGIDHDPLMQMLLHSPRLFIRQFIRVNHIPNCLTCFCVNPISTREGGGEFAPLSYFNIAL